VAAVASLRLPKVSRGFSLDERPAPTRESRTVSYLFLDGVAGTGKSIAPTAVGVHTALDRGWAVLYVPQLNRLLLQTDE
jgi:hypothetical protein